MNAELIRRCLRAMTETGEGSLAPLCRKIVEDERGKGPSGDSRRKRVRK